MFRRFALNVSRQIFSSNILKGSYNPLVVQKNAFVQNVNKLEFLKEPVVKTQTCQSIVGNVNSIVKNSSEGRLFAVVHLCGKQYKVTAGDVVVIEGYWQPTIGDIIRLEKSILTPVFAVAKGLDSSIAYSWITLEFCLIVMVLLVGGDSFTLTGRPLVQSNVVDIQATVVEKTIAHTRTTFKKKRRKQYMRIKFHRSAQSMIRINSIRINPQIDINLTKEMLLDE